MELLALTEVFLALIAALVMYQCKMNRMFECTLLSLKKRISTMASQADLDAAVSRLQSAVTKKLANPISDASVAAINQAADQLDPPTDAPTASDPNAPAPAEQPAQ